MKNSKNENYSVLSNYLSLIRANPRSLIIITAVITIVSVIAALSSRDVYEVQTDIKISTPQGSILTSPVLPNRDFGLGSDLLIANEIQTVKYNYVIREQVAYSVIDTFKAGTSSDYSLIIENEKSPIKKRKLKDFNQIMKILEENVEVKQIGNLDFISIVVESPSPKEAAIIANTYAEAYREFNLAVNRNELTTIRVTLEEQKAEKLSQLKQAENNIKAYQLKGGVIQLDAQALNLINQLSEYESQRNSTQIEISMVKQQLEKYKTELKEKDPSLITFLENKSSEPYLQQLQTEIAKLETQRDLALSGTNSQNSELVAKYNQQIQELKDKLTKSISRYQSMILSSSPEEIKGLTQKVFETEVKYQSLLTSNQQIGSVVNNYEEKFNNLPGRTLDLARLERERSVYEKLYLTLEEKYQEALINEQSIPGNVFIMNYAYPSLSPAKPNRPLIIFFGIIIGFSFGFSFIYLKDYLNKKIKTPEDIENNGFKFLTWIPQIRKSKKGEDDEFIMLSDPDNIVGESFRALRTRIQFSKPGLNIKTMLITSSAPAEGKTLISVNLAGSFARDDKKTIIIDCDLRKPRVHSIMNDSLTPGVSDYLFGKVTFENIIRMSKLSKLDFIPAGTIHSGSSEILNSKKLITLLQKLKEMYDIIIVDSAPILAVTDTEVLSNFVDASLLVVSSHTSELDWMKKAVDLLKHEQSTFLGVILNNYDFKLGYSSSYKYHGYYYNKDETKKSKKKFELRVKKPH